MKNSKILIFGGTTEGRKLAEYLGRNGVRTHVCAATAYGETLVSCSPSLTVSGKRMDKEEIEKFLKAFSPNWVIDATHPYAREVTGTVREVCKEKKLPYLRLVRGSQRSASGVWVEDIHQAAEFLEGTTGNIFVTTGSKELAAFTRLADYRSRTYARVLSVKEVVESCEKLGIRGRHLICMQGPFSKELNLAMLREYEIRYLVTKESGAAGGFREKLEAAEEAGVETVVIGRPETEEGLTYPEIQGFLRQNIGFQPKQTVSLVGIGPGNPDCMTAEGQKACREADVVIGAARMIQTVRKEGQICLEEYRPSAILDYLKAHRELERIAIVLSGDTGFYSGAKKLGALLKEEKIETRWIPGISSAAYFSARLGLCWDDIPLESMHGKSLNVLSRLRQEGKVMFLADSREGIRNLGEELTRYGLGDVQVWVGERLSYEEERIFQTTGKDLQTYEGSGLAILLIQETTGPEEMGASSSSGKDVPEEKEEKEGTVEKREVERSEEAEDRKPKQRRGANLSIGLKDETFLRERIPMTKEEVRRLAIAKLCLTRDAVVYDVGAGTGSVAIETALSLLDGKVYAIEQNPEAVRLLQKNQIRFGASNLQIVEGMAPEALTGLPAPDAVFIGGSKGRMEDILRVILHKNPQARIVLTAIALETVGEVMELCKKGCLLDVEVVQLTVSKAQRAGSYHMMKGQNPVYVISGRGGCDGNS